MPEDNSIPQTESQITEETLAEIKEKEATMPELPTPQENVPQPLESAPEVSNADEAAQIESNQPTVSQQVTEDLTTPEEKAKELLGVSRGRNWLPIIIVVILLILLGGGVAAGMTIFKDQIPFMTVKSTPTPEPVVAIPTPTPIPDPTADWKTYINSTSSFSLRYPTDWGVKENGANSVSIGIPSDLAGKQIYTISISIGNNKSKLNSEEYVNYLFENNSVIKFEKKNSISVGGQQGMELNKVFGVDQLTENIYVAKDDKIFTITFPSGVENSNLLNPIENYKIARQILSTFKFLDAPESVSLNAKILTYSLPTDWKTAKDPTGTFELGYSPTQKINDDSTYEIKGITILSEDPVLKSFRQFISVNIFPYSGGSRHQFIYDRMGETPTQDDKLAGYKEAEYIYNGKSCLVLNGIGISQWPTIWGMCDVGNGRALLMTSFTEDYEKYLQTFKLLK